MKVIIEFQVELPDIKHTEEQLEEYLRYIFKDNGDISTKNPFYEQPDPEPIFGSFGWNYL